jgi:hypothetical protein
MDGALETVEIVGLTAYDDLKGFVIIIAAMLTNDHRNLPWISQCLIHGPLMPHGQGATTIEMAAPLRTASALTDPTHRRVTSFLSRCRAGRRGVIKSRSWAQGMRLWGDARAANGHVAAMSALGQKPADFQKAANVAKRDTGSVPSWLKS